MPPKLNSDNQALDAKSRKLTDFFMVKKDAMTVDRRQTSVSTLSASSPRQGAGVNTASTLKSHSTTKSGFSEATKLAKTPSKNFGSSPFKPASSPRKFIVIEDDDDDKTSPRKTSTLSQTFIVIEDDDEDDDKANKETSPVMSNAKKRPRETISDLPTSTKGNVFGELSSSPPKKRRAVDPLGSSNRRSSTPATSKSLHKRTVSTSSYISIPSSQAGEEIMSLHGTDVLNESQGPPTDPPPSASQSVTEEADASKGTTVRDTTLARIEALKKKAAAAVQLQNSEEHSTIGPIVQLNLDDSEEEEDALDKMFAPKAKTVPQGSKLPQPPGVDGRSELSHLFSPTSPLTSEAEEDAPSVRRNPVRTARSASVTPSLPPPRSKKGRSSRAPSVVLEPPAPRSKGSKKQQVPKSKLNQPPMLPPPPSNMPSSLASLLEGSRVQNGAKLSDPARQAMLQSAERYIKEIERGGLDFNLEQQDTVTEAKEVDQTVTEMALGAEGAQKMKQFFAVDSATVIDAFPWRPLWDDQLIGASDITAESQYQLPSIKLQGVTHPFLSILNQCVESNDADRLLWVLRGGLATSLPSAIVSEHILPWLFNLACSFGIRDDVAITSVNISVNIIRTFNWQECQFPLTFMHFLSPILSLGPLTSAVSVFDLPNVAISPPHDPITRNIILGRIIFVVQSMSQLNVPLPSPEKLTIFCLLLYLEPSTPAYLRRNLSLFLDDMIDSVSADRSLYDDGFVLVLCRKVVDSVSGFRLIEKYQILNCLFGGHATSRHFRRWLAIGLLQPDVVQSLQWPQFKQPPSLLPLVSLLDTKTNSSSPLRISAATNYGDLFHQIEIIGIVLTDVRIYDVQATEMDKVLAGLEYLHGRIDDARAAFLDRTRVKDAIQRMRYRVLYQFQHKTKATIDSMFQR